MENDFDIAMKKIEEIYYEKPNETMILMRRVINSINATDDSEISRWPLIIFMALLVLIGFISYFTDTYLVYFGGLFFFTLSFVTGLSEKGETKLFLTFFSFIGFGMILGSQYSPIIDSRYLSDIGRMLLLFSIIFAIMGYVVYIKYGFNSEASKNKDYLYFSYIFIVVSVFLASLISFFC